MNKLISYILGAIVFYNVSVSLEILLDNSEIELWQNAPQLIGAVCGLIMVLIYRFITGVLKFLILFGIPLGFLALFVTQHGQEIEIQGKNLHEHFDVYIVKFSEDDFVGKVGSLDGFDSSEEVLQNLEDKFDNLSDDEKERLAEWVEMMEEEGAEVSDRLRAKIDPYLEEES